ncbi:MAG TPA: TolC family protein [Bacillota bacterium]
MKKATPLVRRGCALVIATLMIAGIVGSPPVALSQEIVEMDLAAAINYALEHSSTLKIAEHTLEQAEAKKKEAGGEFLPQVKVGLNYVDGGTNPLAELLSNPLFGGDGKVEETPYVASVDITQSIFAAPVWLGYKIAERNAYLNKLDYEKARQELAFSVTSSFLEAIKTAKLVKIAESSLAQARRNLEIAKAHYEAGLFTKNQVLQMELAVAQARQNLLQMENGSKMSLAAFKNSIGMDQDTELRLIEDPGFLELQGIPPQVEVSEEQILRERLDLLASQVTVEIAEYGVKMASAGYYPVAYLNVQYSQNGADGFVFDFDDPGQTITLGLSWSPPLNGKTWNAVKAAKEGLKNAEEGLKLAVQGAKLEIKQATLALAEARQRLELTALGLTLAEENALLATKRFEVGVGTAQEVNEAQIALEQARVNDLNTRYDLFLSELRLEKALGQYRVEYAKGGKISEQE